MRKSIIVVGFCILTVACGTSREQQPRVRSNSNNQVTTSNPGSEQSQEPASSGEQSGGLPGSTEYPLNPENPIGEGHAIPISDSNLGLPNEIIPHVDIVPVALTPGSYRLTEVHCAEGNEVRAEVQGLLQQFSTTNNSIRIHVAGDQTVQLMITRGSRNFRSHSAMTYTPETGQLSGLGGIGDFEHNSPACGTNESQRRAIVVLGLMLPRSRPTVARVVDTTLTLTSNSDFVCGGAEARFVFVNQ